MALEEEENQSFSLWIVCEGSGVDDPLISHMSALLQPTGSAGSAVTTPPPLVRGTQNIPSGKPSLQVSIPSA